MEENNLDIEVFLGSLHMRVSRQQLGWLRHYFLHSFEYLIQY